jgi:chromate transport protein ChrA
MSVSTSRPNVKIWFDSPKKVATGILLAATIGLGVWSLLLLVNTDVFRMVAIFICQFVVVSVGLLVALEVMLSILRKGSLIEGPWQEFAIKIDAVGQLVLMFALMVVELYLNKPKSAPVKTVDASTSDLTPSAKPPTADDPDKEEE